MPRRRSDISQHEEDAPGLVPDEMQESVTPDTVSEALPAIPPVVAYTRPETIGELQGDLCDPDLPYWLALNCVKGVGPARFRLLLVSFGTTAEAWRASPAAWQAAGLDTRTTASLEQQRRRIVPEAELERLQRLCLAVSAQKLSTMANRVLSFPPVAPAR